MSFSFPHLIRYAFIGLILSISSGFGQNITGSFSFTPQNVLVSGDFQLNEKNCNSYPAVGVPLTVSHDKFPQGPGLTYRPDSAVPALLGYTNTIWLSAIQPVSSTLGFISFGGGPGTQTLLLSSLDTGLTNVVAVGGYVNSNNWRYGNPNYFPLCIIPNSNPYPYPLLNGTLGYGPNSLKLETFFYNCSLAFNGTSYTFSIPTSAGLSSQDISKILTSPFVVMNYSNGSVEPNSDSGSASRTQNYYWYVSFGGQVSNLVVQGSLPTGTISSPPYARVGTTFPIFYTITPPK